jgi:hypothetical protein
MPPLCSKASSLRAAYVEALDAEAQATIRANRPNQDGLSLVESRRMRIAAEEDLRGKRRAYWQHVQKHGCGGPGAEKAQKSDHKP